MTPEQELRKIVFQQSVSRMTEPEAKAYLCKLFEQMMAMDNYYKALLTERWGIGPVTLGGQSNE